MMCAEGDAPEVRPKSLNALRRSALGFAEELDGFMAGELQHRCVWRC
jgi:hypothetical protein